MRRLHLILTLLGLLSAVCVSPHRVLAATSLSSTLQFYTSESEFLNTAPIVSTEDFDSFEYLTRWYTPKTVIDQVSYEIDGPCEIEGGPNPCWVILNGASHITNLQQLVVGSTEVISPLRIGLDGGYAHSIGFIMPGGSIIPERTYIQIIVHEINGVDTLIDYGLMAGRSYFGFTSTVGIRGLTLQDKPGDDSEFLGWLFDNVSRSQVFTIQDTDGDGINDDNDLCPNSDLRATVIIGSCDTGVPNKLFPTGETIADQMTKCAVSATNRGQFLACVLRTTAKLRSADVITLKQRIAILRCAAKADWRALQTRPN
jgi:hypothetical protein